jgi:hypothetical protein
MPSSVAAGVSAAPTLSGNGDGVRTLCLSHSDRLARGPPASAYRGNRSSERIHSSDRIFLYE